VEPLTKARRPDNPVKIGYTFDGWYTEDDEKWIFSGYLVTEDITLIAEWVLQIFNAPILEINLENEFNINNVNREVYINSKAKLISPNELILFEDVSTEFRGRGNDSWTSPQKGYRLKFKEPISFFNQPSNRHWVLVASGDQGLRNHYAHTLGGEIFTNIEYTTSSNLIEVFINGNYHGLYNLLEQVRVGNSRVAIESKYGPLDTGYLLEYDAYATGTLGIDYFYVSGLKYPFSIKSPDPDDYREKISEEFYRSQIAYIKSYIEVVTSAIFSNDIELLDALIDMGSFIDMYLLHELFKNTGTGESSFYMYKKPSGKLYFGPPWDFDFSAGLSRGDNSVEGLYVGDASTIHSNLTSNELYVHLMKNDQFVNLVKLRYLNIHENLNLKSNVS
jgi:uncharacterized repeat protein (TIGR02543 family)